MQSLFPALMIAAGAYLIGSLSFAVIVARIMGLPDPRSFGSGNPGATNILRTGKKTAAALAVVPGRIEHARGERRAVAIAPGDLARPGVFERHGRIRAWARKPSM